MPVISDLVEEMAVLDAELALLCAAALFPTSLSSFKLPPDCRFTLPESIISSCLSSFSAVTTLRLEGNFVGDGLLSSLAAAPCASRLFSLHLSSKYGRFSDDSVKSWKSFPALGFLDVSGFKLASHTDKTLCRIGKMSSLQRLALPVRCNPQHNFHKLFKSKKLHLLSELEIAFYCRGNIRALISIFNGAWEWDEASRQNLRKLRVRAKNWPEERQVDVIRLICQATHALFPSLVEPTFSWIPMSVVESDASIFSSMDRLSVAVTKHTSPSTEEKLKEILSSNPNIELELTAWDIPLRAADFPNLTAYDCPYGRELDEVGLPQSIQKFSCTGSLSPVALASLRSSAFPKLTSLDIATFSGTTKDVAAVLEQLPLLEDFASGPIQTDPIVPLVNLSHMKLKRFAVVNASGFAFYNMPLLEEIPHLKAAAVPLKFLLVGVPSLRVLHIAFAIKAARDLTHLVTLKSSLRSLGIEGSSSNNDTIDVAPIALLTLLTRLELKLIKSIDGAVLQEILGSLDRLQSLHIGSIATSSLEFLRHPNLEEVSFNAVTVSDNQPLVFDKKRCPKLVQLSLNRAGISTITIQSLPFLRDVFLSSHHIASIEVHDCPLLFKFELSWTTINDSFAMSGLPRLQCILLTQFTFKGHQMPNFERFPELKSLEHTLPWESERAVSVWEQIMEQCCPPDIPHISAYVDDSLSEYEDDPPKYSFHKDDDEEIANWAWNDMSLIQEWLADKGLAPMGEQERE